ncbi:MAG: hypothetical protein K2X93_28075 [Candidatus Obscuribacterales bacterium]|nr:hypothetical protein [Candidatus Obscuribacterales bacterium]
MKSGLQLFGLLMLLTIVSPAGAQNQTVPPPPNGAVPYVMPAMVPEQMLQAPPQGAPPQAYQAPPQGMSPQGMAPQAMPPQAMQAPPQGAPHQGFPPQGAPPDAQQGAPSQAAPPQGDPASGSVPPPPPTAGYDPNAQWQGQQGYGQPQQWGQPTGGPDPQQMAIIPQNAQGVPPGYGAPMMTRPQSAYEMQEAAIRESQMVEQLEDVKQQKEMEESFRGSVLADFEKTQNKSNSGTDDGSGSAGGWSDGSKYKSGVAKVGGALKSGARMCAPTASYIGTIFLLRGITGGF